MTGILASIKEGKPITSARTRDSVMKCLAYQVCVISVFLLERYMVEGALPAAKLVAGAIGVTEAKSILENVQRVAGVPLFSAVLSKLQSRGGGDKPPEGDR